MAYILMRDLLAAAPSRPEGYLQAVLEAGKKNGARLEISVAKWAELRLQFATPEDRGRIAEKISEHATLAFYKCKQCGKPRPA